MFFNASPLTGWTYTHTHMLQSVSLLLLHREKERERRNPFKKTPLPAPTFSRATKVCVCSCIGVCTSTLTFQVLSGIYFCCLFLFFCRNLELERNRPTCRRNNWNFWLIFLFPFIVSLQLLINPIDLHVQFVKKKIYLKTKKNV